MPLTATKSTPPSTLSLIQRSELNKLVPEFTPAQDPELFEAASNLSNSIEGTEALNDLLGDSSVDNEMHALSRVLNKLLKDEIPSPDERGLKIRDGIISFVTEVIGAKRESLAAEKLSINTQRF